MPAFGDKLSQAQIKTLLAYLYAPPVQPPRWGLPEIRASHVVRHAPGTLPDKPVFQAAPLNLFVFTCSRRASPVAMSWVRTLSRFNRRRMR
jgi:hypothetical protein